MDGSIQQVLDAGKQQGTALESARVQAGSGTSRYYAKTDVWRVHIFGWHQVPLMSTHLMVVRSCLHERLGQHPEAGRVWRQQLTLCQRAVYTPRLAAVAPSCFGCSGSLYLQCRWQCCSACA